MEFTKIRIRRRNPRDQLHWSWAPFFIAFWVFLYFGLVLHLFNNIPRLPTTDDEPFNERQFNAQRAKAILTHIEAIGPRVIGSRGNERAAQFILQEIENVKNAMNKDFFNLEVDLQETSGAFASGGEVNMYQGLQNVVVKLAFKFSNSSSYLLFNSHFDTYPGSPGAGDDGAMVVVMLEVLRVLAVGRQGFDHPIIFLFNGGEEHSHQASYGFITQHKWAKNCKAFINLDSCGSGHRELLLQAGDNSSWLVEYYKKYAPNPFGNTFAEEAYQRISMSSDYHVFTEIAGIPGLELATTNNGYFYHTKYDSHSQIPIESLQHTGDNVLSLARALTNAPELEDPSAHTSKQSVFYDIFGSTLISYTECQGAEINILVSIVALVLLIYSLWCMSEAGEVSFYSVMATAIFVFYIQVLGVVVALGICNRMANDLTMLGASLSWYTNKWMIIGLYMCAAASVYGLTSAIYVQTSKDKMDVSFMTQMVLHSHCLLLVVFTVAATLLRVRSAYILMISVVFYLLPLMVNTITGLYKEGYQWAIVVLVFQIPYFIFMTYTSTTILMSAIPMAGYLGSTSNPELPIGYMACLTILLSLGFIIPLLNLIEKAIPVLLSLLFITGIFMVLTATPFGFPFREETNVQRFNVHHIRRVFHEENASISLCDHKYYFHLQDRRRFDTIKDLFNTSDLTDMSRICTDKYFCGFNIFRSEQRNTTNLITSTCAPNEEETSMDSVQFPPKLILVSKNISHESRTVRYDFELSGPPDMRIYINPIRIMKIVEWSFFNSIPNKPNRQQIISLTMGKDKTPLKFFIKVYTIIKISETTPALELGIGGRYVRTEPSQSDKEFIQKFPPYAYVLLWTSSFERWIY